MSWKCLSVQTSMYLQDNAIIADGLNNNVRTNEMQSNLDKTMPRVNVTEISDVKSVVNTCYKLYRFDYASFVSKMVQKSQRIILSKALSWMKTSIFFQNGYRM